MTSIIEKLNLLRKLMQATGVDYYLVPSRDEHNDEYVPDCWQRRQWLSGFTGSAGDMLVGLEAAYLWTDSRYFLQAEQELDQRHIALMKIAAGTPSISEWLQQQARGAKVGVDPKLISIKQAEHWQRLLRNQQGQLLAIENNLIDQIWNDRPPMPMPLVRLQAESLAGASVAQKIQQLRQQLASRAADTHVLTQLDAIAWVLNVRGEDIDYNPLVISYLIITKESVIWFVDSQKISSEVAAAMAKHGVAIATYDAFAGTLSQLTADVLVDQMTTSWWVKQHIQQARLILAASPVTLMKASKNPQEVAGMRDAHILDGAALVKFFYWLEQHWPMGLNEVSAAQQLDQLRKEQDSCRGLSFATISAFAENAAIVHYQPTSATAKTIDDQALYLVDSGGQYNNGTTDVTRTLHLGLPTARQRRHYTLVLKGHLALRHAVFPQGTCGYQLDSLARQFLWQDGLEYGHGTGHGVGCFLCVHEGPQSISPGANTTALECNMMVSNEPGVYLAGEYGIRIENVCQVIPATIAGYQTFTDLTCVPYARNLIESELLSPTEMSWLNEYHHWVYQELKDKLTLEERNWLALATAPIDL